MRSPWAIALASVLVPSLAGAALHRTTRVVLDPGTRTLRVVDRVALRTTRPSRITLDAPFTIDRLLVDGAPVAGVRAGAPTALALDARDVHEILVEYHGTVAAPSDDVPTVAVASDAATYLTPGSWYPRFEGEDAFTYELTVDVPEAQRAVASGRRGDETIAGGRRAVTFFGEGPIDDLALFAGPYVVRERTHRGRTLRTWFHPEIAELADDYLTSTAQYLDLYDGWIGSYPYSSFDIVSSPWGVGLGFPNLTYMGVRVLRLPFIRDTSLGHEVLHSWWGNGVRVDPDGGNWAEGLTTFMADYTYAERRGADAAREERLRWLREFAVLPAAEDRPIASFRGKAHTASQVTGYHKTALVFAMLRDEIGADAFAGGVRAFWKAHALGVAGWDDLEAAFAGAAGRPLRTFFAQWIQRAGAPSLALRDARAGDRTATFTLTQAAPPYALRVPVAVGTDAGPVDRTLAVSTEATALAVDTTAAPRTLDVDPDLRVFRRLAPAEVPPILREVTFDSTAAIVLVADDADTLQAARDVAARLAERDPPATAADAKAIPDRKALVVGNDTAIAALLVRAGLSVPADVAGRGTARAWAVRRPSGAALAVVSGVDAAALRTIAPVLPHYGAQSWIVFHGRRAAARGLWLPTRGPLHVELAPAAD